MPFNTGIITLSYGTTVGFASPNTYCQNSTTTSDYGACYNILTGKAIFVQTDTATYPVGSLPCETNNTCTRYTTTIDSRSFGTIYSYTNKQAILQFFHARSHASGVQFINNILTTRLFPRPDIGGGVGWFFPSINYEVSSWPVYDPVSGFKAYFNPYTITAGHVALIRWSGSLFTTSLSLTVAEGNLNNIWYAFDFRATWTYESSPLAVIPLDYNRDYAPYQELRNAFGYAVTGVDQPGWNADDIIRVLRELFPDRAWAVFDDRQYVLYLYNLTPDYVPDWLIEKLTPTAMKVLKAPADATVAKAWLDLLNERNAQIPPQTELP